MNTYKYLLFPILFTLLVLSCSKDDTTTPITDSIIGIWQLEQLIESNVEITLSDCFKKTTSEFKSDGTHVFIQFNNEDGCKSETVISTWKKIDSKTVQLTYEDDTEKFTYSIANEKLTMNEIVEDGVSSYKLVFKKIK
jgi:hypothetical protein